MSCHPQAIGRLTTLSREKQKEGASGVADEPPSPAEPSHAVPHPEDIPVRADSVPAFFLARKLPAVGPGARAFRRRHYPDVTDAEWKIVCKMAGL